MTSKLIRKWQTIGIDWLHSTHWGLCSICLQCLFDAIKTGEEEEKKTVDRHLFKFVCNVI